MTDRIDSSRNGSRVPFYVYDEETGRIRNGGVGSMTHASGQAGPGQRVVTGVLANRFKQMHDLETGKLVDSPETPLTVLPLSVKPGDTISITLGTESVVHITANEPMWESMQGNTAGMVYVGLVPSGKYDVQVPEYVRSFFIRARASGHAFSEVEVVVG